MDTGLVRIRVGIPLVAMNVPATVYRTLSCQPTTTRVRTRVRAATTTLAAPTPVSPRRAGCSVSVRTVSSWRTTGRLAKVIEFSARFSFFFLSPLPRTRKGNSITHTVCNARNIKSLGVQANGAKSVT